MGIWFYLLGLCPPFPVEERTDYVAYGPSRKTEPNILRIERYYRIYNPNPLPSAQSRAGLPPKIVLPLFSHSNHHLSLLKDFRQLASGSPTTQNLTFRYDS
jgi:hypothetical protein